MFMLMGGDPINFVDPLGLLCTYSQTNGSISCVDANNPYYNSSGYAGTGKGRNNPKHKIK